MISNPTIILSLRQQWAVVTRFCSNSHSQYMSSCGSFINETPPESFFNLPLLLAYGVLDQVLEELVEQGTVPKPSGKPSLGTRMIASCGVIPWKDYDCVDNGRGERNDLAHEGKLLDREACFRFISAVENELKAWHIL
ncbi:hypothetical protein GJ700_00620 [Duganella sp. FT92W]|uniref:DUF4145 domain-containing protein n=1 Tax=Pseudoduganella rivuli TaxID=2666085 RepID=A0A7X2IIR8_9BURK|nr:hypothetical protein [Pseudoduganella rivuli]MRV70223.1 hypothetical protein [Pseudoduganella rivuli]